MALTCTFPFQYIWQGYSGAGTDASASASGVTGFAQLTSCISSLVGEMQSLRQELQKQKKKKVNLHESHRHVLIT